LTEEEFHGALMADWNRLERKWRRDGLALKLGLGTKQLGKIIAGTSLHPHPHRIFNLLAEDDAAINFVLREYGLKAVPASAVCTGEPGTLKVAVLLHHIAAVEHPDSPGGVEITPHEARAIPEDDLIAAERIIARIRALMEVS
jgi:hypothetical protein